jgi:hypothetical protein
MFFALLCYNYDWCKKYEFIKKIENPPYKKIITTTIAPYGHVTQKWRICLKHLHKNLRQVIFTALLACSLHIMIKNQAIENWIMKSI